MGFYGNITNVNKTQFTFDRTYPNRRTMEDRIFDDAIYLGRYVLVEYGLDVGTTLDTYYKGYYRKQGLSDEFYSSPSFDAKTRLKWTKTADPKNPLRGIDDKILSGQLIYVEIDITPEDTDPTTTYVFYQCINDSSSKEGDIAIFEKVVANTSPYTTNYNIDLAKFDQGQGRGYDSTVWQKVYSEGKDKYVMIAELNSVVPTFALTEDPPTMVPLTPHFDADSTNVYYKLHWQPQWGLRVAAKEGEPSDSPTIWVKEEYDPKTDKKKKLYFNASTNEWKEYYSFKEVLSNENAHMPAAIHYNLAAFDAQLDTERTSEEGIAKHVNDTNYFTILPTGKSGKEYNMHDGTGEFRSAEDIQEIRVNLPAIGNMMSDAWDIIHGPRRNDDMRQYDENGDVVESLQGRLDSIAAINANEIPVKRISDGRLVGTKINGDNNKLPSEIPEILREALSTSLTEDDAWIYTKIDSNAINDEHNNGIAIHHTFHATQDSVSSINKNDSSTTTSEYYKTSDLPTENLSANRDEIHLYTPYVDAAGHVVGKNIETVTLPYSYRTYTTTGLSSVDNADIYTVITPGANGADSSAASCDSSNTIADQTQDTLEINPVNKWIQAEFENDKLTLAHEIHAIPTTSNGTTNLNLESGAANEDNINIPDFEYDAAGHIIGKHDHKYTLPFGFKTITTNGTTEVVTNMDTVTESIVADTTQDTLAINSFNRWIRLANSANADSVTIAHEVNPIPVESNGTTNANKESGAINEDNINIPDWSFDEAGHITEKHDHHYTLPFGFKTIKTNGRSTEVAENASGTPVISDVVAETTQDVLTINSGNKWIRIDSNATSDSLTIRHDVHATSSDSNTTDWTKTEANTTIPVVTYSYDEAGHYTKHHTENYKLPFGYGKIKGDSGDTAATATYDELTFGSDDWLTATITADKVVYSHDYPKAAEDTISTSDINGNGDTIVLETLVHDEKGHITHVNQNTVTLPFGYKTFNGDTGTSSADNTQDIMNVNGDNWINVAVSNDAIKLTHKTPVQGTAVTKNNEEPVFGATFILDDHHFDANGHKFTSTTHTVKIPALSLVSGTGNVVTGITLPDPTKGQFVETKANIGSLLMTDYAKPTTLSDQSVLATESLNTAIGKLEYRLEAENTRAVKAEENLGKRIDAILDGVTEEELNTFKELSDALNDDTNFATTVNNAIAGVQTNLNNEITARENADIAINGKIDALNAAPSASITQEQIVAWDSLETNVQTDWNATEGAAVILNKPADIVFESSQFIYSPEVTDAETGEVTTEALMMTIADLMKKVKELEDRIATLEG